MSTDWNAFFLGAISALNTLGLIQCIFGCRHQRENRK